LPISQKLKDLMTIYNCNVFTFKPAIHVEDTEFLIGILPLLVKYSTLCEE